MDFDPTYPYDKSFNGWGYVLCKYLVLKNSLFMKCIVSWASWSVRKGKQPSSVLKSPLNSLLRRETEVLEPRHCFHNHYSYQFKTTKPHDSLTWWHLISP